MKTEDKRLNEIFKKYLATNPDIPDFEFMWKKARGEKRKRGIWTWRVAASIALIAAVSTLAILQRKDNRKDSGIPLTSWTEPTRMLAIPESDMQVSALTHWTSPTRFLIPENNHPTK